MPPPHHAGRDLRGANVIRMRLAVLATVVAWLPAAAAGAGDVPGVVERVKPAIVAVGTYERTRSPQFDFRGTGFAVDDGTLIVTNAHVVPGVLDGAKREQVGVIVPQKGTGQGAFREARLVAMDPGTDLAVLKISGEPLPALKVADSGRVREGQEVLFSGFPIGSVLGIFPATHRGMVAAIAPVAIPQARSADLDPKVVRRLAQGSFDVFQLDATAYPGNSGSPLVDPDTGEVIGVVNMVLVKSTKEAVLAQPSGISYAVPSRYVTELLAKPR
ncbi:MAG: serine protease [Burkholderiales bacterium]